MKCVPEDDVLALKLDMLMQVAYAEYRNRVEHQAEEEEEVEILKDAYGRVIIRIWRRCFEDTCVLCYETSDEVLDLIDQVRDIHDARQLLRYLINKESDMNLNLSILGAL